MRYKVKNFNRSFELAAYLNETSIAKILYVGPSKEGYTLIYLG